MRACTWYEASSTSDTQVGRLLPWPPVSVCRIDEYRVSLPGVLSPPLSEAAARSLIACLAEGGA